MSETVRVHPRIPRPRRLPPLALAAVVAWTAAAAAQTRPIQLDDWYAFKSVGGLTVSADGRTAAFTVSDIDRAKDRRSSSLWRVPVDGGEPQRLTYTGSASSPRFSPDGRFLAFVTDRHVAGGPTPQKISERGQVFLLPLEGGEAFPVTALKEGVDSYRWAPDSRRLLVVSRDPRADDGDKKEGETETTPPVVVTRLQHKRDGAGYLDLRRRHFYLISLGAALESPGRAVGDAKALTTGRHDESEPAWSPDGRSVAFSSNRSDEPDENDNTDIWIIDVQSGDTRRLTTDQGSDENPIWSPDGRSIAYVHTPENPPVYATPRVLVIPAQGGAPRDLTGRLDRHVSGSPRWAADGRSILVALADDGRTPLVRVTLEGTRTTVYDGDVGAFEIAPAAHADTRGGDGYIVMTASTPSRPTEVYALAPGAREPTALSRANDELFAKLAFNPAENIHFKSADGTPVEGWLVKPLDFNAAKKHPLVLRIHGGPVGQFTDAFSFEHQYLASLGYVVVFTNPRGSNGYGEAFCRAIFADWGNKDTQDVVAGVDHVIAQGYVDPKRLGVGGWSYGGILTNYVITKTARFGAAISGASEVDMFSSFGTDDLRRWWIRELGYPWRNLDLYRRLSPIMDVEKVTTPTMLMGGDRDFRVPLSQSEQMYVALRSLGKTAALVIYPGQSHGISKPSYQVDRLRRYGLWYDKYILGKDVDPTYEVWKEEKKKTETQ